MGRTFVADERIQGIIDGFNAADACKIGLIVGQISNQRDFVLHLCQTPSSDEDQQEQSQVAKKSMDVKDIDERWVATHAKQVLRMLPGGLDILGIFIVSSQDDINVAQIQLRKVLNAVQKIVDKSRSGIPRDIIHNDRVVLQICKHTKKITCRTYDVADMKSAARPADWKIQSLSSSFISVESNMTLDHTILISTQNMSQTLTKQIQIGLSPILSRIGSCMGMFGGKLVDLNESINAPIQSSQPKKSKKGGAKVNLENNFLQNLQVQLLMKTPVSNKDQSQIIKCAAKMVLKGTLCGRAHVHGKSTYQDALNAIRCDIGKSLVARCELLCEDLLQAEEEQDPKVLYETPVRIFGAVPQTSLTFCDYMFPDEAASDPLGRFKEILGLNLAEENLNTEIESFPTEETLAQLTEGFPGNEKNSQNSSTNRRIFDAVGLIGSGVAVLSALMYYMFLGEQ